MGGGQVRIAGLCLFLLFSAYPVMAENVGMEGIENFPTAKRFTVCSNHGCRKITTIYAFHKEWELVRAFFQHSDTRTPEEERRVIAQTVGLMESLVEKLAGTSGDEGGNSLFITEGRTDCVDESINTMHYVQMMIQDGMVHFHKVVDRVYRFFPHWTAVIEEKATGKQYSVDSWFYDNGVPAVVYPLEAWLAGQSTQKGDYLPPMDVAWDTLDSVAYAEHAVRKTTELVEHK